MNKITINVPRGIRYISEWNEFKLPEVPTIINKQICGCGFTEWCLNNSDNVILVSPRRVLLENKADQHLEDPRLLYVRNDGEKIIGFDKDLNRETSTTKEEDSESRGCLVHIQELHQAVINHYSEIPLTQGCKFSVTYDSFRHIREALGDRINSFYIVIDEMQSVFIDAKFKSDTGIELLNQLSGLNRVCFVSATPMLDKYLEMLDEFKNLNYISLDWGAEDPGRVTRPQLETHQCSSIITEASKVIDQYLRGEFEYYSYKDESGKIQEIVSNEAVLYVNSVKTICEIIKRNRLTIENTNIICARTLENIKKVKSAFNSVINELNTTIKDKIWSTPGLDGDEREKLYKKSAISKVITSDVIGKVPKKEDIHKMFTLCTRTVYLGADFYSTCARTFIFSDANIDSLSVDVSMDLPQILGRQRLEENPWKNRATMFCKTISKKNVLDFDEFSNRLNNKKEKTESLLRTFNKTELKDKQILAENYKKVAKVFNYADDYVAVNEHAGGILVPEFNNLVLVSELRCFEIQQIDYKNRVTLFSAIKSDDTTELIYSKIDQSVDEFNNFSFFVDKMRYLCNIKLTPDELGEFLERIPITFKNYYNTVGLERCRALKYQQGEIKKEYETLLTKQDESFLDTIYKEFEVGKRYTKSYIKEKLRTIYLDANRSVVSKATDLLEWFSVVDCKIPMGDGSRVAGFEILKRI